MDPKRLRALVVLLSLMSLLGEPYPHLQNPMNHNIVAVCYILLYVIPIWYYMDHKSLRGPEVVIVLSDPSW